MEKNQKYEFLSGPYRIDRKLYKYFSNIDYAINCIKNRQIHLDDPRSFNDPFDSAFSFPHISMMTIKISEKTMFMQISDYLFSLPTKKHTEKHMSIIEEMMLIELSKMSFLSTNSIEQPALDIINKIYTLCETDKFSLKEFINEIDKSFAEKKRKMYLECRVSCFSEINDSILMWSYYADNHKGICLEFDLSKLNEDDKMNQDIKKNLSRVHYSPIRADIQYQLVNDSGLNFLTSKADVWKHELEWRLICVTNEEFLPFDCITGVYLGVNFPLSSKEYEKIVDAVNAYPDLPIYQGQLSLTKYEIEYRPDYHNYLKTHIDMNTSK